MNARRSFLQRFFVASLFVGILPAALLATDNVTVSSTTYSGTSTVQADNTITTSSSVVVNNGANVTFQSGAHTTLATGFKVNAGGLFRVAVGQMLPYAPSFESSEGFTLGSITNQRGWILTQGTVDISNASAYLGSYSVAISATTPAGAARQVFLASSSPSITFVEVFAKPVATTSATNSSLIVTESVQVGFQIASGQGAVYVFDGVGSNTWVDTGVRFAINGSNQSTNWLRLTVREDYTNHKWDLSVNGVLADYDLAFLSNSESYFRGLGLTGTTTATAYFDGLLVQSGNPLYTDTDKDGMSNAWENANGTNPNVDDRNGTGNFSGLTNIEAYFRGYGLYNPRGGGADGNGLPDAWEIAYFGHTGVDPNGDPDEDGYTNLEEYQLGSNPTKGFLSEPAGAVKLRVYTPRQEPHFEE